MKTPTIALAAALAAGAAAAECPPADAVAAFAAARSAGAPAPAPIAADAGLGTAYCAQDMLIELRAREIGPVIGYKAGLTSEKSQAAFGVSEPVLGTLTEAMMLESGAEVAVAEGVRPLFEADLLVEIADAAVMEATTPEEVVAHVAGVRPFLELPDLAVTQDVKLDGPMLTAINVAAWRGVAGERVEIPRDAEGVAMLGGFTARLTGADGETISEAPASAVLGHPLEAVIWVADALRRQGKALEAGDLVSVGSIGPLHPMKPGMAVRLTYEGLPGTPMLDASFR